MAHTAFLNLSSTTSRPMMLRVAFTRKPKAIILVAACAHILTASGLLHAQNTAPAAGLGAAPTNLPAAAVATPVAAPAAGPTVTASGSAGGGGSSGGGGGGSATQPRAGGPVSLNFAAAEIEAVARTIAVISNRNVVVDPRVKGVMSLVTTSPVSPAQALRLFSLQLRTQGFALVESAGLYLVVPEADAKLQSGAVSTAPVKNASGQIVTQIFRLNHETANNLVPVLRPLISPNNTINVNPGNNSLIITDYSDNLQRIGTIIASLDVANATCPYNAAVVESISRMPGPPLGPS